MGLPSGVDESAPHVNSKEQQMILVTGVSGGLGGLIHRGLTG
ncbi:hypothetical protein [Nonomuraea ceibae]|nr:hypothetical protein [Nonomuraea ceibae]